MLTTTEPIITDLDQPPAPHIDERPHSQLQTVLPWALFGITAIALLSMLLPGPAASIAPAERAPGEVTKLETGPEGAILEWLAVYRDGPEAPISAVVQIVRPSPGNDPATCWISVNGVRVAEPQAGFSGELAICVWTNSGA